MNRQSAKRPNVAAWKNLELGPRLPGGARNPVYRARRGHTDLVVRVSGRSDASLDWELDLLAELTKHGLTVPQTLPTDDGRRHSDGILVQEFIPGVAPQNAADRQRVVRTLQVVHSITRNWPQRPGFASATSLLTSERGGDVDFGTMPAGAADVIRNSWGPLLEEPESVVHGDVGAGNVLITDE